MVVDGCQPGWFGAEPEHNKILSEAPKGGHRRPFILMLGELGSGRLATVAVAPWREDGR